MGAFDNVDEIPRRVMTLFLVVDTSGSMSGKKIASLNVAAREVIPFISDLSSSNADAQIKIAVLEFSSGTEWMYPQPMDAENFQWRDLEAGGLTDLGEACIELGNKLSTKAYMTEATGSFAPAIILMSDGEPTDDYKRGLEKLKANNWFKAAIKVAIAIGDDADLNVLAEFTGLCEAVLTVHNKEQLKKIIHFVSVTASQVASKSASVGKDDPETKQEENVEKLKEALDNNSDLQGVDVGTDVPSTITPIINITDDVESYSSTMGFCENKRATYNATVQKSKKSIWSKLFGNKYNEVYSSIFAPAEVKRKSHLQVQVFLHLYEESEKVKSLAKESDKNAERRDYIPLSLKLKKGDKVDVEFNIYGETRLASERKSTIWQGSFAKCTFDYFVPKDIDVDELSCEANLFVNGAMIGEMRFLTQIVEVPRNLNPEILSHRFNRIFISYAHQDAQQIKLLALAYKAQGVDYFYDRDSLAPGDVYEEKIFDYIDSSDLFVLCWSKNAAVSDYVAKEKGRALLRAYPQLSQRDATLKICPISIEPRADLPSDMKEVYNFEVI